MDVPIRAALYTRSISSSDSVDTRLGTLERLSTMHDWRVVATVADQTTGIALTRSDRPVFDALLRDTSFDVLVVWSLSDLATAVPELIRGISELRNHGIDLLAYDDRIDTTTEAGKAALTAFAALAEFERNLFRQRAQAGIERARRTGTRLGRPSNMNPAVEAAILALRARGVALRRIASQLGVGTTSVYRVLERHMCFASLGSDLNCGTPLARLGSAPAGTHSRGLAD